MRYSLVTLDLPSGPQGALRVGSLDVPLDVPLDAVGRALDRPELPTQLIDVMYRWSDHAPTLDRAAEGLAARTLDVPEASRHPIGSVPLLTPLRFPRKVICAGANYPQHLAEMNVSYERREGERPFFFLKPPTTTLVGPGSTSPMPSGCTMLDWEVELAVVIGHGGRHLAVEEALDHVAAYAIAVDLSARDLLVRPDTIFKFDFLAGKSQDGSCPLGPELIPARFVSDPHALTLQLAVNGVTKQDASTRDMIFSVAEQIAGASHYVMLEPGDVILTGTPHGVGFPRGDRLQVGDSVVARVEGLTALEFSITS